MNSQPTHQWIFALTLIAALGSGLMSGVFFAFSVFVMKALARLPAAQGIAAMQSINIAAINPAFGVGLFGTAGACLGLALSSAWTWHKPGAIHSFAGGLIYLLGIILVTFVCNIPRNDALAAIDPASVHAPRIWAAYLTSWSAWNHVRTAAGIAASALFTFALC